LAALLTVKHNIEVAHRLSMTPGKCQNIHGHSMIVELSISGAVNEAGLLVPNAKATEPNANKGPIEFGEMKEWFRTMLDMALDHKLLLNENDPLRRDIAGLPGATWFPGDPTTENIAKWVYESAYKHFIQMEMQPMSGRSAIVVTVHETQVNSATYGDHSP
jgi:6-pyruvoyltetrahydropterin/6-carboxytetrahydropterin synthase